MAAASLTVHAAALGRPSGQTTCSGCGISLQPSPRRRTSHPMAAAAAAAVGSASYSTNASPSSRSSSSSSSPSSSPSSSYPSGSLFCSSPSRAMPLLQPCRCSAPPSSAASCSPACHSPSSGCCASSTLSPPRSCRSRRGAVSYDCYRRPVATWPATGRRVNGSQEQLLVPTRSRHDRGVAGIQSDNLSIQGGIIGMGVEVEDGRRRTRRRWTPTIVRCAGSDERSGGTGGGEVGGDKVDSSSSSSSSSSNSSSPNSMTTTTTTTTTTKTTTAATETKVVGITSPTTEVVDKPVGSSSETEAGVNVDGGVGEPQLPLPTGPSGGGDNLPTSHGEEEKVRLDAFSVMELLGPEKVDSEDVKLLRDRLFGYTTFWVTKQEPYGDFGEGVLLMGNLRGQREEVYEKLQKSLKELMGDKYDLFMIEEPNADSPDPRGGPRVSFVLLRKEVSQLGPTTFWQYILAVGLFFLTAGACLELGLASQVSRLPEEIVTYFASPDPQNMTTPDVSSLAPYVDSALPVAYAVFGVQLIHEAGHWVAAFPRKMRLRMPYFIPNITIGSFGSITQFASICPDRTAKFDVSIAGPVAGGVLSLGVFAYGLALSVSPSSPDDLIQVPSLLFQGSLALGIACRAVLGFKAVHAPIVAIHPLLVAGWCGLTTTALNLLPVGCLDGGRALQAAYGKGVLQVTSIVTYVLLGLSLLGGSLSLPWGLYVLILQRNQEKSALNDVTEVGTLRQGLLVFLLALSALILLPVLPPIAEDLGIGPTTLDPFL